MTDAEHDESDAPARAALPRSETQEILFHSSAPDLAQEEIVRHARHELGHALGFKHEHLRFIQNELAGWCIESGEFRAVTDPDRNSVMGYGSCSGIDGLVFSPQNISSLDRKGLAYLYNLPRNEVPSFTSEAFDDVLWFTPRTAEYVLWRGSLGANPGSPIVFTPEVPTCSLLSACNDDSFFRIRPIPASVTEGRFADTVMYGPGAIPDSFLEHTQNGPLVTHAGEIDVHPFDLPLVGQFDGLDPQEEIWWVRPGDLTDPLGIVSGANTYIVSSGQDDGLGTSSDQHFQPVVGLWAERGSRRPNSQVIWYRQRDTSMRLAFQSSNGASIMEEAVAPACFFGGLVWPTPLRGDFDGDDEMEVLWVSPINNTSVLWRDTATMWGGGNIACSQVAQSFPLPTTFQHSKPFVGDFDGDGSDDVYWYTPEPFADVIWIDIGGPGGPDSISPIVSGTPDPLTGDFTPVVGDFNGDLCDDILWFSPDTDFEEVPFDPTGGQSPPVPHPGSSPLWRSNCDPPLFTGFTAEEPELVAPPGAYPVGYDPRSAPRRADLSPTVP